MGGATGHLRTSTTGYRRELSLREAVARVGYAAGGVEYTREYFAGNPGNVIVARISANQTGRVSFTLRHTSPRTDKTVTASNGRLTIRGRLADNGLRFEAQVQVVKQGGTRTDSGDRVTVSGAESVMLVLSAGTDYSDGYPAYRGADPQAGVTSRVTTAAPAGPRHGRSASGPGCSAAPAPTSRSANSSSPPRWTTCGTPTRRCPRR
ncbi:glycoside hydrolase N-terminal domain-containing protein [Streptosporangium sp. NPDC023825]|uniref:glycoside hydrolase N-terminal domain-containing protein n=1 Tax=Streptosporangium sp. NPDC023825 TaxID=3154909 RepID=UPI003427D52B